MKNHINENKYFAYNSFVVAFPIPCCNARRKTYLQRCLYKQVADTVALIASRIRGITCSVRWPKNMRYTHYIILTPRTRSACIIAQNDVITGADFNFRRQKQRKTCGRLRKCPFFIWPL